MPDITISLTDTELKCLEYAAAVPQDWADNALTNRARIAKDEIIAALVAHSTQTVWLLRQVKMHRLHKRLF